MNHKIKKVFSCGKILDIDLYLQLQNLDLTNPNFKDCGNEFKPNRDWWVYTDKKNNIIAYCGSIYAEDICIFNRAWVKRRYRGKGLHRKMINIRLNAAKKRSKIAITYTIYQNYASANNLIKAGFQLYGPQYEYGGKVMYFRKDLHIIKKPK